MNLLPILLGLGCAAGLMLIIDGLRRRDPDPSPTRRARREWTSADQTRLLAAVAAGFAVALLTRWPVAALLTAAGVWTLPRVLGPDRELTRAVERIEASSRAVAAKLVRHSESCPPW